MSKHEDGQSANEHGGRLRTLTLPRPRCPRCGNVLLKKYRSLRDQGDGSSLSWVRCTKCEERFRVLLE
jgi:DNA-directed RNA polymerase subunit M/transcription elongation factor TFIIS